MTSRLTEDAPATTEELGPGSDLGERLVRLEGEVAELRHTLSDLAEIVVGDIKERRETAIAVSAPVIPEIPPSLVAGSESGTRLGSSGRRPWLLTDLLREVGTTVRMYMDPRYRVRRATQLMIPLLFGMIVANYLFFNVLFVQIPVLTPIIERLITIVLAVLVYKVLAREVGRYRQMLAQIAVTPRTWSAVPTSLLNNDPDTAALTRQESP